MFRYTQASRVIAAALIGVASLIMATPVAYAKAPPLTSDDVFILLPGLDTALSKDNIKSSVTPGFDSVETAITQAVSDAQFVTYSYTGPVSKANPQPRPYTCVPTLETPVSVDAKVLNKQIEAVIAARPNANIYLIGHSLGGVVAYTYMGLLAETGVFNSSISAHIKGVVTLDSPIGGVSSDSSYFTAAESYFEASCAGFNSALPTALIGLTNVFDSFSGTAQPRGGQASVLAIPFPKKDHVPQPAPINKTIAQDAHDNLGINTMTVGNWNDLLWDPSQCGLSVNQFIATQWIWDSITPGIYGRTLTSGTTGLCFLTGPLDQANHFVVLSDPNTMQAIQEFITGQVPSALPAATAES